MNASVPVLELQGVARTFTTPAGPLPVLRDVSLRVDPGDFVAITGPSGSGKSTLLHLCGLLDTPTSGRILFEGAAVSHLAEAARSRLRAGRLGMVFQAFHLLPDRTVFDNVLFRFRYTGATAAEAVERTRAALDHVGLSARAQHPARLLSGGEMQRVAIARAIAMPPALLLADEPTGNLDAAASRAVMEQFDGLNRRGIAILLATHNPALLAHCRRHWVCAEGTVRPADAEIVR